MATKKATPGGSGVTNYVANAPTDDPMPTSTPTAQEQPIGVPPGYMARRPNPFAGSTYVPQGGQGDIAVAPQYYETDLLQILYNMDPANLPLLQQAMIDAGVYGSKNPNYTPGIPDQETIAAFRQVLTAANATGLDYVTVIQNWGQIAKTAPPKPKAPRVTTVTNTDDLVAVFRTASRQALGRELSDAEAKRFASTYQAQQGQYDATVNAMSDAQQSGTVQQVASPDAFLDARLKAQRPGEYGANRYAQQMDTFQSLIRGPFSGQ